MIHATRITSVLKYCFLSTYRMVTPWLYCNSASYVPAGSVRKAAEDKSSPRFYKVGMKINFNSPSILPQYHARFALWLLHYSFYLS
jgi:hypothetical protein